MQRAFDGLLAPASGESWKQDSGKIDGESWKRNLNIQEQKSQVTAR